jgi:hypothetical protein
LAFSPFVCFRHTGKRSAFALGFFWLEHYRGIAKGILSFKIFPDNKTADYITQFFPLESMSNLIVEPFSRLSVIKLSVLKLELTVLKTTAFIFHQ